MNGYYLGVNAKLEELKRMMEKKVTEKGLVPIDPAKQALDWYKERNKVKEGKAKSVKFKQDGFQAGKDVSIHKGLDKKKDKLAIGH